MISTRLDLCNSLLANISKENLHKLQKVQNSAARLILGERRRDSGRLSLRELHWLNVETRIVFKIILIAFKVVKGMSPDNLTLKYKAFNGRPSDFLILETPNYRTKYGKRLFEYNGPRYWNALPLDLRMEEDIETFKKRVKTMLFDGCADFKKSAFKYD